MLSYILVAIAAGIQGWVEIKYDISGKEYFFLLLAGFLFIGGGALI